jgi:hypothetical protein
LLSSMQAELGSDVRNVEWTSAARLVALLSESLRRCATVASPLPSVVLRLRRLQDQLLVGPSAASPFRNVRDIFGLVEPVRCRLGDFVLISGSLANPGYYPIGAHQHRAQAEPLLHVARGISEPATPTACKLLVRSTNVEVQEHALPIAKEFAESCPVEQLEVGRAASHQIMRAPKIAAQRNAPDAPGEICRSVTRVDEIADDRFERARTLLRALHGFHFGGARRQDLAYQH